MIIKDRNIKSKKIWVKIRKEIYRIEKDDKEKKGKRKEGEEGRKREREREK